LLDLVGDEGQALRFEELDLLIRESHRTRPRAYYLQRVPVMRQVLINATWAKAQLWTRRHDVKTYW
jgi:hypothetical protein